MDRYFKKLGSSVGNTSSRSENSPTPLEEAQSPQQHTPSTQKCRIDVSVLPSDPADRWPISNYDVNDRDEVRRAYIQRGPYQPRNDTYPQTILFGYARRFNKSWYDKYSNWLEYSLKNDACYCLCCYLFATESEIASHYGGDTFISKGFRTWNNIKRLDKHIGGPNSIHNQCVKRCEDLMMQKQSIQVAFHRQSDQAKVEYRNRLNASVDIARLILYSGLPFRGHDESETSSRKGNFLTFLEFFAKKNESVGSVVLKNAPGNNQMTSPPIQKDIANACYKETIKAILEELGDDYFAILVDESRDVSCKQQMALVLRYVDKRGFVMERLVGLAHVTSTTAESLKETIYSMLAQLSLSPSRIRGQGYDGASNMRGHINGLRTLIQNDCSSAHYVHCFAHQLQLTLVKVAHKHVDVEHLIELTNLALNTIGVSYKRRDEFREKQAEMVEKALSEGELLTGKGLNQEVGLQKPGDTRWGSHFNTFSNFIQMFSPIVDVLDALVVAGDDDRIKIQAILDGIQTFDFAFMIHLMKLVLGISNGLSLSLQRRDQDVVNAMSLLGTTKKRYQKTRDEGWESLMNEVESFCVKRDIDIPRMDDLAPLRARGKSKRRLSDVTNEHYYRVNVFYTIIDMLMQELDCRFPEISTDLLIGVGCLNPANSFSYYNKEKVLKMAKLYPDDFDYLALDCLSFELDTFIDNFSTDKRFSSLSTLGEFSKTLVQSGLYKSCPHFHKLLKLALILPVSTATVERVFSAMKIIKTELRNRISDEFLNDTVVAYFECDLFQSLSNEDIMRRFQNMKTRRGQLP
ncbi:unnamed protein product [Amaranthus hypochondriacus]